MAPQVMLAGEPMGLFIAQEEGPLENVGSYTMAVAGAEFNVAVGLSRLGHSVGYLSKLGEDPFGKRIAHVMEENAISSQWLSYSKERPTGFMLKNRVSQGDPEIFYFRKNSAASTLSPQDIGAVDFSGCKLVHMTGILPALSLTARQAAFSLMKKARESGVLVSFDPNLRPQLWESREVMVQVLNELASQADFVFPGEAEGEILMGSRDPKAISEFYLNLGAKTVITKVGSRGAYAATAQRQFMVKGFPVQEVVDTVGAGDGFAAGVLSGILENCDLEECVLRGNAVGAIQVMSRGDNEGLPTREQLAAFMGRSEL